ncbi:MAG: hypothetical protein DRH08_01860 [Deltaproteobacteria bacterium]|nr:MAG: hypothetical protein DRH08_01860 [Deltaproteobacteria bacterium]
MRGAYDHLTLSQVAEKAITIGGYTNCLRDNMYNMGVRRFGVIPFTAAYDRAMELIKRKYPQGWKHCPGDVCKHGVYHDPIRDCSCFLCEEGI